jgi:hypothetical protein
MNTMHTIKFTTLLILAILCMESCQTDKDIKDWTNQEAMVRLF